MLMKPLLGTKPGDRAEHTGTVSAFMELVSSLREAGSANKCISCPDGGGNKDHKVGKGRAAGPGCCFERSRRTGRKALIRSGGLNSVVHPSRSPRVFPPHLPTLFSQQVKPPAFRAFASCFPLSKSVILLHLLQVFASVSPFPGEPWLDYPV